MLDKLLAFPIDKLFPCLDLYRMFLCHPDAAMHFKKFEEGQNHLYILLGVLQTPNAPDPAKMLALRCVCNCFMDSSAIFVLKEKRAKVIESIAPHLMNKKATIREAALTILLNYSVVYLAKDDPEGKADVL